MEEQTERSGLSSDQAAGAEAVGTPGDVPAGVGPEAEEIAEIAEVPEVTGETLEWDPGESGHDPGLMPDELGQRPATGEPRVDAALARLDELAGRPVMEHRAIFEDVHRRLRDVLGELDTREHSADQEAATGAAGGAGAERQASR
jgi:hypothetical protein